MQISINRDLQFKTVSDPGCVKALRCGDLTPGLRFEGFNGANLKKRRGMPMWKFISLMLISCAANASIFSCVDKNGTKVLQNFPCEQHEKQQEIVQIVKPAQAVTTNTQLESMGSDSIDPEPTSLKPQIDRVRLTAVPDNSCERGLMHL